LFYSNNGIFSSQVDSNNQNLLEQTTSMRLLLLPVIALALGLVPAWLTIPNHSRDMQARPDIGINASLHGRRPFPSDSPWNQRIDKESVDPNSDAIIAAIGLSSHLHPDFARSPNSGIPYVVVPGNSAGIPVVFESESESDPGPYPIPSNAPIEGGSSSKGDRHILVIDRDNWKLYETWKSVHRGTWVKAGSGAVFDLNSNDQRPAGWTSADAAGLPVFPGLVRYDEVVMRGKIEHALRFTARRTRRAYVAPARHFASQSEETTLPPMGMRVRLKANFDISAFPECAQVVLKALKTYGMILADNGGNWYISGAPDPRWDETELNSLIRVLGRDLEVVKMGELVTR
jgi:hypothetical protein